MIAQIDFQPPDSSDADESRLGFDVVPGLAAIYAELQERPLAPELKCHRHRLFKWDRDLKLRRSHAVYRGKAFVAVAPEFSLRGGLVYRVTLTMHEHQEFLRQLAQLIELRKGTSIERLATRYRAGPELLAAIAHVRPAQPAARPSTPYRSRKPPTVASPAQPQPLVAVNVAPPILPSEVVASLPGYWQILMAMDPTGFDRFCERIGLIALAIAMRSVKIEQVTAAAAPLGVKLARKLLEVMATTSISWPQEARRGLRSVYNHLAITRVREDLLRGVGVSLVTTIYNTMDQSLRRRVNSPRLRAILDAHPMSPCRLPAWPGLVEAIIDQASKDSIQTL